MPKGKRNKRREVLRNAMDALPTPDAGDLYKMFDVAEQQAWRYIAGAYLSAHDDDDCEGR